MTKRLTFAFIIPALFSFFTAWRMASAGSARAAATLFSRRERPGMFKHHSTFHRRLVVCLVPITLLGLLIGLKVRFHRPNGSNTQPAAIKLQGEEATRFLETSSELSLTQALNDERFKLSWNDRWPFGEKSGGYLALSHEQNINAWLSEDGVTIRPTGSDPKDKWTFGMRLKAYGYADDLQPAPALVKRDASKTRIEYERKSGITEWYENRSTGIEQGFTINERPEFKNAHDLRFVIAISGDVKPLFYDAGTQIKLLNNEGKQVLTYGQLSAIDANKRTLPSHLETTAEGTELILVVDDRDATYPIVIDPITASEQGRLMAGLNQPQGRFGFSVAIDGALAVIGAPTTDGPGFAIADVGKVYVFLRTGTTWNFEQEFFHPTLSSPSLRCGYSVDIFGEFLVYGCPGSATTQGSVIVLVRAAANSYTMFPLDAPEVHPGDRFGAAVAIDETSVLVGAPFYDLGGSDFNRGAAFLFDVDSTHALSSLYIPNVRNQLFRDNFYGADVAIDNQDGMLTLVIGEPNAEEFGLGDVPGPLNQGAVQIYTRNATGQFVGDLRIHASDFAADDQFGFSVAISGNTIAVGAPFDDNEKGTNAGSVYVFRRMNNLVWQQEAKLVASDGFANDEFSYFGLGIKNSTIVVGSHLADGPNFPFDPNENRGEVYIYTPVNEVWTEQSRVRASDGSPGDEFGLGIDLDGSSLIVGAPNDDISLSDDAGSAYVYTLSCPSVPAPTIKTVVGDVSVHTDSITLCENTRPGLVAEGGAIIDPTYQWRKNGVGIPGETNSFVFKFFTAADAGTYDVVVSNSCTSRISAPVVVNVNSGCNVTPLSQNVPNTTGSGSLNVTACPDCYWGATVFTNPFSFGFNLSTFGGRGNGSLNFTFTRNPYALARTIEYEIAGQRALISQDPSPNFIVTEGAGSGRATLLDIVARANETPGDDVLTFDLPGAGPHIIDLFNNVIIRANLKIVNDRIGDESVTVRRDPLRGSFRVFEIQPNVNVSISGLTISDGEVLDDEGSAILNNGGRLSLRNCTITNNKS